MYLAATKNNHTTLENLPPDPRRKIHRWKNQKTNAKIKIRFSVERDLHTIGQGQVVDLSLSGLGMVTKTMLEPGMVLRFKQHRAIDLPQKGVVVWSMRTKDVTKAGIRFI